LLDVDRASGDAAGKAIHQDLSSGTLFGSRIITDVPAGALVSIDLNSDAISALNRRRSSNFAIGGSLLEGGVPAIPEPATWALMLLGFLSLGMAARSHKRRRKVAFSCA
jgi:hypothetical protein